VINKIASLLLALWLGAALLFSAVVAPTSFRVLRNFNLPNAGEIAGTIVSRTLSVVNVGGFVVSVLVFVAVLAFGRKYSRGRLVAQLALLTTIAVATAAGEWLIAARMRALRAAMIVPIDQVPLTDANRVAFAALHGYSVAALGVAIMAGLLTFFLLGSRGRTTA